MREYGQRPSQRHVFRILLGSLFLYVAIIIGINVIGPKIERVERREVFGDIDNRFPSSVTLEHGGRTYNYRDQDTENILIIGVDKTSMDSADSDHPFRGQADFLLLLAIDRQQKRITPIQIDRDTMADIQIYGIFGDRAGKRNAQISLAQAFGDSADINCRNTVEAVSGLFSGIEISHYVAVNMNGIEVFNDALGGVSVTLEEDFSEFDPRMKAGTTLTLKGIQSQYYVRARKAVSDGTNRARMKRQSTYLNAAMGIPHRKMADDLNFVGSLYDAMQGQLLSDMTRGALVNKAYAYSQYEREDIRNIAGLYTIGEDGFVEFHADGDSLMAFATSLFFE